MPPEDVNAAAAAPAPANARPPIEIPFEIIDLCDSSDEDTAAPVAAVKIETLEEEKEEAVSTSTSPVDTTISNEKSSVGRGCSKEGSSADSSTRDQETPSIPAAAETAPDSTAATTLPSSTAVAANNNEPSSQRPSPPQLQLVPYVPPLLHGWYVRSTERIETAVKAAPPDSKSTANSSEVSQQPPPPPQVPEGTTAAAAAAPSSATAAPNTSAAGAPSVESAPEDSKTSLLSAFFTSAASTSANNEEASQLFGPATNNVAPSHPGVPKETSGSTSVETTAVPDLTTTTMMLPSVSSAGMNNGSSQLTPNAATCDAPSNPVPRKGTSDSDAVEATAISSTPPVVDNESSKLGPTAAASSAAPSHTGVASRKETLDSAADAEIAHETMTMRPSDSSTPAAVAPTKEANGPWWKNEPVPSFQKIWPILEKIGFSETSDGKFLLPKNSPGLQKLRSVPTFQSIDGLRKFLCAFGIPCFQETSTRLIQDEPEQLHRWITFANVPVHSGDSIERLAGITAPQNDTEVLTLLSRFRFEQVDGNLYLYVPDYKKIRKAGEAWGKRTHVHFFDVKELETSLRVFVRGAWRFGLLIDSEDDHEGPDKFLRMDSKKQERLLRLRLWAAESKEPLPTFTEKSLEITDKTGTVIVSAEARLKPFEMMPQTDQPNEKIGGGSSNSENKRTSALVSGTPKNKKKTKVEHWWKHEPVPPFRMIWPILKKLAFSKTEDGKFLLPENIPGMDKIKRITFSTRSGLRKFLCQFGVPCYLPETDIRLDDAEKEQLRRWIAFANVPVHSGNSIERLAGITAPQNDAELLSWLSKFRFDRVDGNVYVPDYKKIRRAGEAWGEPIPHVHYFNVEELKKGLRVFVRGAWSLGLMFDSEEAQLDPDRFLTPSRFLKLTDQETHMRLRLWGATTSMDLPEFSAESLKLLTKDGGELVPVEARLAPFEIMPDFEEDLDDFPSRAEEPSASDEASPATPSVAPSNLSKVSSSSSSLKNQSEAIAKVICSMVREGDVDDAAVFHNAANVSVPIDTILRVTRGQDIDTRAEEQQQSTSSALAAANNETSQQQLPPPPPPLQLPSQSVVPQPASDVTVTSWCCDVCQVRSFPTYQEACDHEDKCRTQQQQLLLSRQNDAAQQPQSKAAALADDGGSNALAESEARGGQPQEPESISSVTATSESPSSKPSYSCDAGAGAATNEPFDSSLVASGTSATDALLVSSSTDAETEEAAGTSSDAAATKSPPVASFTSDTLREPLAETCSIAAATDALSVSTSTDAETKDLSGTSSTVTTANDSPVASSAVKNTTTKKPLVETCRTIAATLVSWVSSSTDAAMKELSPTSSTAAVSTKVSSSASSAGDTTKKHSSVTSSSVDRTREPLEDSCTAAAVTTNDATLAANEISSASMHSLSSPFPGGEGNALSGASGARSCTAAAAAMNDATLATNGAPPASMGSLPSSQEGESPSFGPSSVQARMFESSCNGKVSISSTAEAPPGTTSASAKRKGAAEAGGMIQPLDGTSSQCNRSDMLESEDGSCFPRSRRTDRREPFILDDSPDETKALPQDRGTVRRKRAAKKTAGLKGRRKEPPVSALTKEEKEPVARLVSYDGSCTSSGSSNEHASATSNSEEDAAKRNRGLSASSAVSDTKDSPPESPAKRARVVLTIEDDSDDDETIASDSKPPARPIQCARTELEESDESEIEVWCLGSRSASEPTTSTDCGRQKTAAPAAETASSSDSSVCDDGASSATASPQEEGCPSIKKGFWPDMSKLAREHKESGISEGPRRRPKISKRGCSSEQPKSKRMRLDDGDASTRGRLSGAITSSPKSGSYAEKWQDGNGICKNRAESFAGKIEQCGSCSACATECCGICGLCRFGPAEDACVFKCCEKNVATTKTKYFNEIHAMLSERSDRGLERGIRVYARWHGTSQWYWGEIRKKYMHSGGRRILYSITYEEDGDSMHNVPEKDILDEYEKRLTDEKTRFLKESTATGESGCGCTNCLKARCGKCVVCRGEASSHLSYLSGECATCLQQMCLHCQEPQKAPGLPDGWEYGFSLPPAYDRAAASFNGLWVQLPNGRKFRSIDRALAFLGQQSLRLDAKAISLDGNLDPAVFYNFVGLTGAVDTKYSIDADPVLSNDHGRKESGSSVGDNAPAAETGCRCVNCTKVDCGTCVNCTKPGTKSTCLQKMCLNRQEAQTAPGLPDNWGYVFREPSQDSTFCAFMGLRIIAPNGMVFRTVERAANCRTVPASDRAFDAAVFYEFVGLTGVVDPKHPSKSPVARKQTEYADTLEVGSRCYARFSNGYYYWGEIASKNGAGKKLTFDVQFDDGDFLPGVDNRHVDTVKGALDAGEMDPAEPGSRQTLSLLDLHSQRCKTCAMCVKDDCGRCRACKSNADVSSPRKQTCLMKMCKRKKPEEKMQHITGLPSVWHYYFTPAVSPRRKSSSRLLASLHPDLLLHVVVGDVSYDCLAEALEDRGYCPKKQVNEIVREFYEKQLGIPLRRQCKKHCLVGKGWYAEWIDAREQRREIFGEITECWESIFDDNEELAFTVRYDDRMRSWARQMSEETGLIIPKFSEISERRAWGGCEAFKQTMVHMDPDAEENAVPFHHKWIVPGTRFQETPDVHAAGSGQSLPHLVMVVGGYELRFEAKQSKISKDAGLGLFVSISRLLSSNSPSDSFFELQAGDLIDLGPYAPLLDTDCKLEEVVTVKNFLDRWYAEGWSFAKEAKCTSTAFDLFDITKDDKGVLNDAAVKNILVYANESDGKKEVPTLFCQYDAEGSVHYLLGHSEEDQGPLKFPLEKELELKIDYGDLYEKVRVRKGYPRVTGDARKQLQKECERDDSEVDDDISNYTAKAVDACLLVLEGRLNAQPQQPNLDERFERELIVAIGLRAQTKAILEEFRGFDLKDKEEYCDNGVSSMEENESDRRSKRVVQLACGRWGGDGVDLKATIEAMDLLKECVTKHLHLSDDALERLSARKLRKLILDL